MGFLDMGPLEILLILAIALIIWGPGKIPEIARTLGRTVRALRKATYDLTQSVTKELEREEKDLTSQSRDKNSNQAKEPSSADKAAPGNHKTTSPGEQ